MVPSSPLRRCLPIRISGRPSASMSATSGTGPPLRFASVFQSGAPVAPSSAIGRLALLTVTTSFLPSALMSAMRVEAIPPPPPGTDQCTVPVAGSRATTRLGRPVAMATSGKSWSSTTPSMLSSVSWPTTGADQEPKEPSLNWYSITAFHGSLIATSGCRQVLSMGTIVGVTSATSQARSTQSAVPSASRSGKPSSTRRSASLSAPSHSSCSTQALSWHARPGSQASSQPPQCSGSTLRSTQAPRQAVRSGSQPTTQAPSAQRSPGSQGLSQPPQCSGSLCGSTQAPAHSSAPGGQPPVVGSDERVPGPVALSLSPSVAASVALSLPSVVVGMVVVGIVGAVVV